MSERAHREWLLGELPALERDGLVDAALAARLRERYAVAPKAALLPVLFGVLGAILVGLGVILLIAHNWDELGRPLRSALCFAPLLLAQALGGWTLLQRAHSLAWRESAAVLLLLAIAASIALVGQTWHLAEDQAAFMMTWLLLALPLAYLFDAVAAALGCLLLLCLWSLSPEVRWPAAVFTLLAAALLPFYLQRLRPDRHGWAVSILGWGWVGTLAYCCGVLVELGLLGDVLSWSVCFGLCLLIDALWFDAPVALWRRPYRIAGWLGLAFLALYASFEECWSDLRDGSLAEVASFDALVLGWGLWLAFAGLWVLVLLRRQWAAATWGALVPLALVGSLLVGRGASPLLPMLLFNGYVLALGLMLLRQGLAEHRLGMVNGGMLLLSALILVRFLDSDLSYTARGIGFLVVGAGFFTANRLLARRLQGNAGAGTPGALA